MAEFCFCIGNTREPSLKTAVEKIDRTDYYKEVFGNIYFGDNSFGLFVICGHTSVTRKILLYLMLYLKIVYYITIIFKLKNFLYSYYS